MPSADQPLQSTLSLGRWAPARRCCPPATASSCGLTGPAVRMGRRPKLGERTEMLARLFLLFPISPALDPGQGGPRETDGTPHAHMTGPDRRWQLSRAIERQKLQGQGEQWHALSAAEPLRAGDDSVMIGCPYAAFKETKIMCSGTVLEPSGEFLSLLGFLSTLKFI